MSPQPRRYRKRFPSRERPTTSSSSGSSSPSKKTRDSLGRIVDMLQTLATSEWAALIPPLEGVIKTSIRLGKRAAKLAIVRPSNGNGE